VSKKEDDERKKRAQERPDKCEPESFRAYIITRHGREKFLWLMRLQTTGQEDET
jgi:hypothetical protein